MKLRHWLRRLGSGVWSGWPETAYQQETYQLRLLAVQRHLAECLDIAPHGSVRVISMCAGDGRDVIGVLGSHQRRKDVVAWLVELNRQSVAGGVRQTTIAGLQDSVSFINADATVCETYNGIAPSDIILLCGVWGHVPIHERGLVIRAIASLCKPGGTVIWTRGVSRGMTRLHEIQSLFAGPCWQKVRVSLTSDNKWAVATHRYCGPPKELPGSGRLFHFQPNAGHRTTVDRFLDFSLSDK